MSNYEATVAEWNASYKESVGECPYLRALDSDKMRPNDFDELLEIVQSRIRNEGENCNLNDIDISEVKNLSGLFLATIYCLTRKRNFKFC